MVEKERGEKRSTRRPRLRRSLSAGAVAGPSGVLCPGLFLKLRFFHSKQNIFNKYNKSNQIMSSSRRPLLMHAVCSSPFLTLVLPILILVERVYGA